MQEDDSLDVLQRIVRRIHMADPSFELQSHDLLDVLWLAHTMTGSVEESAPEASEVAQTERASLASDVPTAKSASGSPAPSGEATPEAPPDEPSAERATPYPRLDVPPSPQTAIYTAPAEADESPVRKISTLPLRAPGTAGLPDSLRIARALRPLMRRMPSRTAAVIDEVGTADRIAYEGIPVPVWKPAASRWLDLALVVDRGGAMHIWSKPVAELRTVFERHGAFGSVRAWNIVHDSGELRVRPWSRRSRRVKPLELVDPTGRQLMVIVSDCVAEAWTDGRMARLIGAWGAHSPVVLLNVLPDSLWSRTALRYATPTVLRATAPAVPNNALLALSDDPLLPVASETMVKLPVATLDSVSLSELAHLVAATGGATARGVALATEISAEEVRQLARRRETLRRSPPDERVRYFDNRAGYGARQLARLFAAAPYPLIEPVMRLIQRTILRETDPSAIAEVLLVGGLMERVDAAEDAPERTRYDYTDPALRDALLEDANRADLIDVLTTDVSQYVGEHFGDTIDFAALIRDPAAIGELEIPESQRPFALIGAAVLQRLGGRYREVGTELLKRVEDRSERKGDADRAESERAALFRFWLNTPRRRRVELAAYLGDPDACRLTGRAQRKIESLVTWVDDLAQFGLPVLLYAAVIATEGTHFGEGNEPLAAAIATLRTWASGGPLNLGPVPAGGARATIASIVYAALRRDRSMAEETRRRVQLLIYEARRHVAVDRVSGTIRDALLHELTRDESVVPDGLPERATVLLIASRAASPTAHLKLATTILARKLAANGYRLITSQCGVLEPLAAYSFATEVEAFGHIAADRLTDLDSDRASRRTKSSGRAIEACDVAVILGNVDSTTAPLEAIRDLGKITVPVLCAGEQVSEFARKLGKARRRVMQFLSSEGTTHEDVELLTERVIATLEMLGSDVSRAAWKAYSKLVADLTGACERRYVTEDPYTNALREHCSSARFPMADILLTLPHLAQWLAFDYVAFARSELSSRHRNPFSKFGQLVRDYAAEDTLRLLGRHFPDVGRLPPLRRIGALTAAARELFRAGEFADWTRATAGLSPEECEFRASIPETAYALSARYVTAKPVRYESDDADALRRALTGVEARDEWLEPFFLSASHEIRTIAYMLSRLGGRAVAAAAWAERLGVEVRRAVSSAESRPLWQMIQATFGIVDRGDATDKRILARALRSVLSVLEPTGTVDRPGQCKKRIRQLLDGPLARAVIENEQIRLAASHFRRDATFEIPDEIEGLALSGAELRSLYATGGSQALLAVGLTGVVADHEALALLRHVLSEATQSRELLIALQAATNVAPVLFPAELSQLLEALNRKVSRHVLPADRTEPVIRKVTTLLERSVAPPMGIAILGSDRSDERPGIAAFCMVLGRELARHGISAGVADPALARGLAEGYGVEGSRKLLLFRSTSDVRPVPRGLASRTIEGASDAVHRELLAAVSGAVVIGGDDQTIEHYSMARKRLLRVVPVPGSGSAAHRIGSVALPVLEGDEIPDSFLRTLFSGALSVAVAMAVVRALASAITGRTSHGRGPLHGITTAALIAEAQKRARDPEFLAHVGRLIESAHWTNWSIDIRTARDMDRRMRELARTSKDVWIHEVVARCEYVRMLAELIDVVPRSDKTQSIAVVVQAAMNYVSLSTVSSPVLLQLQATLKRHAAELPQPWVANIVTTIADEIKRRSLR